MTLLVASRLPFGSDTVSVTVYRPGSSYVCEAVWPPDCADPSPKLQCRDRGSPSGSRDASANRTRSGADPSRGVAENPACGGWSSGDGGGVPPALPPPPPGPVMEVGGTAPCSPWPGPFGGSGGPSGPPPSPSGPPPSSSAHAGVSCSGRRLNM